MARIWHGKSAPVTVIILYKYYLYVGSDRPLLKDLHRYVVNKAAPEWRYLGYALLPHKQHPVIDSIAASHPGDVATCCMRVLERWLDTDADPTWNQLISALKVGARGLPHLANYLEQMMIRECEIIYSTCRQS